MRLTQVIKMWDILHVKDVGDLGYSDLEKAVEFVDGIENDVPVVLPRKPITKADVDQSYGLSK